MAAPSGPQSKRRGLFDNINLTSYSIFYNLLLASLAAGFVWSAIVFTVL